MKTVNCRKQDLPECPTPRQCPLADPERCSVDSLADAVGVHGLCPAVEPMEGAELQQARKEYFRVMEGNAAMRNLRRVRRRKGM